MPLSSYSILLNPYVAFTQAEFVSDIQNLSKPFNIGYADTLFPGCYRIEVGKQYIFRQEPTEAILITAGGTDYIIVTESDCISDQIIPV